MSKELRVKKGEIEIAIQFETTEELQKKLEDFDKILTVVQEKLGVSFESKKIIRKDLEGICDFDNNHVVLIKSPTSKVKKVCLVMYAHGPTGATLDEIALESGISNPSKNVINAGSNKTYFRKLSKGQYALTDKGISFVTSEILPELKGNGNGTN